MPTLTRITAQQVEALGWRKGSSLENLVAHRMAKWGWTTGEQPNPRNVVQQHREGKYRLDFAWPHIKVALEVDGWHHRSPEGAERDAKRDSWLRSEGWLVFRVDDVRGEHVLYEQLANVLRAVHVLLLWHH